MFVMFPGGRCLEVFKGTPDDACRKCSSDLDISSLEEFEQSLGVFLFLVGGFFKDAGDLSKAFFLRFAGKISVTVSCLGFTGKCGSQVFFCLGSFYACHKFLSLVINGLKIRYCA